MEKLENRLKNFLTNHTVDEINIDEVKKTFSNLKERTEEKYTLLHAIADESFPIEKAIKTIECFLKLGVNPNAQDIYGKYTFIHLAFYSNYPFSFFEKVIPLALEYNFNINSKDEDGDTIMHSAIYSEDYLDKIYPLFALLNDNFNLEAKNNLNKNLLEALKESIYEAKKIKNENWYNELISEEKEITTYLTNKYKFLEENREKIKEQQRILEEKRQYQNFLINFKKN